MKIHNPLPESLGITCGKAASVMEHFVKGKYEVDNKLIPTAVLKQAYGIAILTIVKAGCLWSARAGTGLVVARLDDGSWSAPSAIAAGGVGIGAQVGAQITDVVFVLNNRTAVKAFMHGNVTIGGNISIAAGPTGRSSEAGGSIVNPAPIYSYSKSKGLFVGITLEGTIIMTRKDANRKLYGRNVTASDLLEGRVPPPVQAEPLYRMLNMRFGQNISFGSNTTLSAEAPGYDEIRETQTMPRASIVKTSVVVTNYATQPRVVPPKPPKALKPKSGIALFDFQGQQPGDLSFQKGDALYITGQKGDWYEGNCNGERGIFPGNYVSIN